VWVTDLRKSWRRGSRRHPAPWPGWPPPAAHRKNTSTAGQSPCRSAAGSVCSAAVSWRVEILEEGARTVGHWRHALLFPQNVIGSRLTPKEAPCVTLLHNERWERAAIHPSARPTIHHGRRPPLSGRTTRRLNIKNQKHEIASKGPNSGKPWEPSIHQKL